MTYLDPLTLGRIAANAQNATAREALLACGVQMLALLLLGLLHGRLWRVPPMPSRPLQQQALLRTAEALLQHPVHCHCFRRKAHDKRASVSLASFRMAVDGETDASLSLTAGDLAAVRELLSELDLHIERVRGSQQVVLDAFMWFTNPGGNHEWHTDGVRSAPSSYEQQLRVTIPLVGRYDVLFRCPVGQHVGLSTSPDAGGYAMDMVASGAHAATCLIDGSSISMHLQHCVAPVQQLTCCVIVDYAGPVGPCSTSNQLQPLVPTPLVPTPLLPMPLVPAEHLTVISGWPLYGQPCTKQSVQTTLWAVLVALQQAWHRVADQQPVGRRVFTEDQARLLKAAYSEWSSLEGRSIPLNHVWSNAVAQLTGVDLLRLFSWRRKNGFP
eukprot:XP_001691958.1 predicted protein [Chlamydomonas reinhardtii]